MSNVGKKHSVLIIDDMPMMLNILGSALKADYAVMVAKDGEKGIASAKKHKPSIILLDIVMPGMTGFEVIEILKACEEVKDIPVIFLTGDSTDESKEKGLQLGAVDYIEKNSAQDAIKERVALVLQRYVI